MSQVAQHRAYHVPGARCPGRTLRLVTYLSHTQAFSVGAPPNPACLICIWKQATCLLPRNECGKQAVCLLGVDGLDGVGLDFVS